MDDLQFQSNARRVSIPTTNMIQTGQTGQDNIQFYPPTKQNIIHLDKEVPDSPPREFLARKQPSASSTSTLSAVQEQRKQRNKKKNKKQDEAFHNQYAGISNINENHPVYQSKNSDDSSTEFSTEGTESVSTESSFESSASSASSSSGRHRHRRSHHSQRAEKTEKERIAAEKKAEKLRRDFNKREMIEKLKVLKAKNYPINSNFTMDSPYDEVKMEYDVIFKQLKVMDSIKNYRQILLTFFRTFEWFNQSDYNVLKRFGLDLEVNGITDSVNSDVERFDEVFEQIHEKYMTDVEVDPLLKCTFMICMTIFTYHMSQSVMKKMMGMMQQPMMQPQVQQHQPQPQQHQPQPQQPQQHQPRPGYQQSYDVRGDIPIPVDSRQGPMRRPRVDDNLTEISETEIEGMQRFSSGSSGSESDRKSVV